MPSSPSDSSSPSNQEKLGSIPQIIDASVDGEGQLAQGSRARDGGEIEAQRPDAEAVARAIETHSQIRRDSMTIRSIIEAFPEIRQMMVAEAVRGITATVQCWNAKLQAYEEKIDYAVRQKWVAWLAGYSDGLPVQTNMNFNASPRRGQTENEDAALALSSPALREELKRQIADAEKRDRTLTDKKSAVSV